MKEPLWKPELPSSEENSKESVASREKRKEVGALSENLGEDSVRAESLEAEVAEQTEHISERDIEAQSFFGRARDSFQKMALLLPLLAVLSMPGEESRASENPGEPQTKKETIQKHEEGQETYESPDYGPAERAEDKEKLRLFLSEKGIKQPASGKETRAFFALIVEIVDGKHGPELEDALTRVRDAAEEDYDKMHGEKKEYVREDEIKELKKLEKLKKQGSIGEEEWQAILKKIDYPKILENSAFRFGIQPYKRIGYQRYQKFNSDVFATTDDINGRIESINKELHTNYPALSPGLIAATVLQEGLAEQIDHYGYFPDRLIDSFSDMGLDSLRGDLPELEKKGLLEKGFGSRVITRTKKHEEFSLIRALFEDVHENIIGGERGLTIRRLVLREKESIAAVAAILAERRNAIIDKVGTKEWNRFTPEEQDWLTYAAYQWGLGNVVQLLIAHSLPTGGGKSIPIANYLKYKNGKPAGRVETVSDFIWKDNGRRTVKSELIPDMKGGLSDFHYQTSQVVVSAGVANKFFAAYASRNSLK